LTGAIKRAMAANGGTIPSRKQVLDAVAHAQFSGVTDHYSFDSAGDTISPLMSLYQVQNGRWVYMKQIEASSTWLAGLRSDCEAHEP
jgi:ABC-type branched-subunit amino acid transport system substrate-binding protein